MSFPFPRPFPGPSMVSFSVLSLFSEGEVGAWYDPSDFSTMFQDAAGTTPVTAVEQPVGLIRDKSGRGNHASQTTSTSRPVLKQDANGKYYLLFDGTDDWLQTGTINPGSVNKVQVFAGVRKLSDAAVGEVVGLGTSPAGLNGTFFLRAPSGIAANYQFRSRGTTQNGASYTNALVAAPVTNVLGGIGDISGPNEVLRVNGVAVASNTLTQGTGNYNAHPLFIGRTAGTSNAFNGNLYGLIVRFSAANLPDATIAKAETWMNTKTGAY